MRNFSIEVTADMMLGDSAFIGQAKMLASTGNYTPLAHRPGECIYGVRVKVASTMMSDKEVPWNIMIIKPERAAHMTQLPEIERLGSVEEGRIDFSQVFNIDSLPPRLLVQWMEAQ